jgi:hypothetical protein
MPGSGVRSTLLGLVLGLPALASSGPARFTPHEEVPFAPGDRGPVPLPLPEALPSARRALPEAISYRGLVLPAPPSSPEPRAHEPVLRPMPPAAPEEATSPFSPEPAVSDGEPAPEGATPELARTDRYEPDAFTGGDPALRYASTFQPSVAPFKRFDAKDTVGPDFLLRVGDRTLRPLQTGGGRRPGRELFYGSVVVLASGGAPVPIPSVAPGARILRWETTPAARARFFKDGADNHSVAVEGTGLVRLNFLTDAPTSYFGGAIPPLLLAEVPVALRPRLPSGVRSAALAVLSRLGVSPLATVDAALSALVRHFRAYRAGSSPRLAPGPELFRRLALDGLGACRHRAYAFVILAQALGLPARFVANEAHAFSEVWLPQSGWRRIDLGGVSPELTVYGAERKVAHRPREADPLPRPAAYERSYSTQPSPGLAASPPPVPTVTDVASVPFEPAPPEPPPEVRPAEAPGTAGRQPARVVLSSVQEDVLRGEALEIRGRVEGAGGAGLPGLRVDVYLTEIGADRRVRVGVLLTDEKGEIRARLPISVDLPVGRYRLHAETAGNKHIAAASSLP